MRYLKKHGVFAAGILAFAAAAGLWFDARSARAGDLDDVGWTVEQEGKRWTYLFKDRWVAEPNLSGFTLRNVGTGVTHYFYGTFRVVERRKS